MNPTVLLTRLRRIWPLDWRIDPGASDPAVIVAERGALGVAVGLTSPLTVVGTLGDRDFFEVETNDLEQALAELEERFRQLTDVPTLI